MASLALYDKRNGEADRQADEFFKADYIYKKNCLTRVGVVVGFGLMMCFYAINFLFLNEINFMLVDLKSLAIKIGVLLLSILVAYTIIGTIIHGREYDAAQKRLSGYKGLVKRLDNIIREENSRDYGKVDRVKTNRN